MKRRPGRAHGPLKFGIVRRMERAVPLLFLTIEPRTPDDAAKLRTGLQQLTQEDPSFHAWIDSRGFTVGAAGERPLEIAIDRLRREFAVEASLSRPRVASRVAFTTAAEGHGRFIRQTGGRGHFGEVTLRLIPGAAGSGCRFENKSPAGTIPEEFVAAIDEGIRDELRRGTLAGQPIADVRVVLCDGSYHESDSSEQAFQIAAGMAFRDAAAKARPVWLEPIMRVEVTAPQAYVPFVAAELASRQGQMGMTEEHGDAQVVVARVPLTAMFGYANDLQALTDGHATFTMRLDAFEPRLAEPGDDDGYLFVGVPRQPRPGLNHGAIALPEPDDSEYDRS
jgi:elongation factor G